MSRGVRRKIDEIIVPVMEGSLTKDCPDRAEGGKLPVHAYLRHSMMVVFPQPLAPTIIVRGL